MKRLLAVLLALLLLASFSACGGSGVFNGVGRFLSEVDAGNYQTAQELYYDDVYGNTDKEYQSEQALLERLDEAVSDYNDGTKDYGQASAAITTIDRVGVLDLEAVDEAAGKLNELQRSKASFESAESLFANGYYADALSAYLAVADYDANYTAAQQKAEEASTLILDDIRAQTDTLAADGEFEQALALVTNTEAVIGEEQSLLVLRTELEAKYTDDALTRAREIFSSTQDHEAAIRIMTAAINTLGEDARLTAALAEYQAYIPVYLKDMDYFDLNSDTSDNSFTQVHLKVYDAPMDNFGTIYENGLIVYTYDGFNEGAASAYVTYHLGGNYSSFSGTAITPYDVRTSGSSRYFQVYGDDVLLFTSNKMTTGSYPQEFTIDVEGVTFLKILFTPPYTWGRQAMICDATLKK